jgi:hypothetical protein
MKRLLSGVVLLLPFSVIALLTLNISSALAIGNTPEAKNMRLVSAARPAEHLADRRRTYCLSFAPTAGARVSRPGTELNS